MEGGSATLRKRVTTATEDLSRLTKAELYKLATDLDIPHRSAMNRDELQDAVQKVLEVRRFAGAPRSAGHNPPGRAFIGERLD